MKKAQVAGLLGAIFNPLWPFSLVFPVFLFFPPASLFGAAILRRYPRLGGGLLLVGAAPLYLLGLFARPNGIASATVCLVPAVLMSVATVLAIKTSRLPSSHRASAWKQVPIGLFAGLGVVCALLAVASFLSLVYEQNRADILIFFGAKPDMGVVRQELANVLSLRDLPVSVVSVSERRSHPDRPEERLPKVMVMELDCEFVVTRQTSVTWRGPVHPFDPIGLIADIGDPGAGLDVYAQTYAGPRGAASKGDRLTLPMTLTFEMRDRRWQLR